MSGGRAVTRVLREPNVEPIPPQAARGGARIAAIDLLRVFSPDQWEDFTLEWAHSLKETYERVEQCGGAGDLGRDIVAYLPGGGWHNFQCKHYRSGLQPSSILVELGKLCYYVHTGAFSAPEKYYFVAPEGVGNKLRKLLADPAALRQLLIDDWDKKCADGITSTATITLTGTLLDFVRVFDFSIVGYIPPIDLLEQHAKTRWYAARFPGELPSRAPTIIPPLNAETFDCTYVRRLLEAYSDHTGKALDVPGLHAHQELRRHLHRSRERFFHAEALRNFSRDNLPVGQFERLQDEFYDGVIDTVDDSDHIDGYRRVRETTKIAQSIHPSNNALSAVLGTADKAGICHQLANDDRLKWVP